MEGGGESFHIWDWVGPGGTGCVLCPFCHLTKWVLMHSIGIHPVELRLNSFACPGGGSGGLFGVCCGVQTEGGGGAVWCVM